MCVVTLFVIESVATAAAAVAYVELCIQFVFLMVKLNPLIFWDNSDVLFLEAQQLGCDDC